MSSGVSIKDVENYIRREITHNLDLMKKYPQEEYKVMFENFEGNFYILMLILSQITEGPTIFENSMYKEYDGPVGLFPVSYVLDKWEAEP